MRIIPLTKNKVTVVDDLDYEKISKYKWYYAQGYAARGVNVRGVVKIHFLHNLLLPLRAGYKADHANLNTLDNRRLNLRYVTNSQNGANRSKFKNNTSGYKGVYWHKATKKWCASIRVNYKSVALGYHHDPVEAAKAYNTAALEYFGEYAWLNDV